MSPVIDQRVVEMGFDNARFEKNVHTSISTLDKLKAALNLDGATKGISNVESAFNKSKTSMGKIYKSYSIALQRLGRRLGNYQ